MLRVWAGQHHAVESDESEHAPTPLDVPPQKLYQELESKRESMAKYIRQQLKTYDSTCAFPRKQDAIHMCRDGYESHVCSKAMKELHRDMQVSVKPITDATSTSQVQLVIIALMAVHITTENRFNKLLQTLKSIEQQRYSSADLELVVAVSWYAANEELAAKVATALQEFVVARTRALAPAGDDTGSVPPDMAEGSSSSSTGSPAAATGAEKEALTVLVVQSQRRTQFQHMRAALAAAEADIRARRCGSQSTEGNADGADRQASRPPSFWTIFGDDDDLWHPRRVAEYAQNIRSHPRLDSVGIFATTARADVKAPAESGEHVEDGQLPSTVSEIDDFISAKLGERLDKQEPCAEFARNLKLMGADAALLPIQDGIALEYFNFCARLRILHEFFDQTSEAVLAHRFCDLRLCEFFSTYSRMGHELGLAVEWFDTDCWMYFYANAGLDMATFQKNFELEDGEDSETVAPMLIGGEKGHVSTMIPLEDTDIKLADQVCPEMLTEDETLTPARLARYFAAFRSNISMELVRRHTRTVDQRLLDWLIFTWAIPSFGKFTETLKKKSPFMKSIAATKLFRRCQGIARTVMEEFDVKMSWVKQGDFLTPEPVDVDAQGNVVNPKSIQPGQQLPLGLQYFNYVT